MEVIHYPEVPDRRQEGEAWITKALHNVLVDASGPGQQAGSEHGVVEVIPLEEFREVQRDPAPKAFSEGAIAEREELR